jgi:predicted GNAT family acetyltransferase
LESSVILVSNIERSGLDYRGQRYQATYAAHFDERGEITALAAHSWNGMVVVQGDRGVEEAARLSVQSSGRELKGIIGPWSLACRARDALGRGNAIVTHESREVLMALQLADLRVPELLSQSDVSVVVPTEEEAREIIVPWRVEYEVEAMNVVRDAELERRSRETILASRAEGTLWMLKVGDKFAAMSAFNACTHGIVQVGGVYTPRELRGRGYARSAVAGSLLAARTQGAVRSTLFTGQSMAAAQRAYQALGYREVGDYGLIFF